jgi:PST family polysaccharide transporter
MENDRSSYKQIAKSTGIFGGSQLLNMLLGMVRTKLLAVLLGTAGVGMTGMFQSITDLMRSITGLGLSFSAVKDIAEAGQSDDEERIGATVTMLQRWLWLTGIVGMLLTIGFSPLISRYVFGNEDQILSICLLSFCVLAGTVSSGQLALLQGFRKIAHMAQSSLYGALGGLVTAVPLYLLFGMKGIVPALLVMALVGLFFTWLFARRIHYTKVTQSWKQTASKGKSMVKLGLYTVASGLISTLTLFLMRSYILNSDGVSHVGLFQAVWSVSSVYMGGILTSMAADYFPRLCRLNHDNEQVVRFTNEQTRFVLLVSTPLIVALLLVAPPILELLYSNSFHGAATLLRWQILGTFMKVMVWPLGFILLSKSKGPRFLLVEAFWYLAYYFITRFFWDEYGLDAAGIAYVAAYLLYIPLVYFLVKPLCGFRFEWRNKYLLLLYGAFVLGAFVVTECVHGKLLIGVGVGILLLCTAWSGYEINKIIPFKDWSRLLVKRIFKRSA